MKDDQKQPKLETDEESSNTGAENTDRTSSAGNNCNETVAAGEKVQISSAEQQPLPKLRNANVSTGNVSTGGIRSRRPSGRLAEKLITARAASDASNNVNTNSASSTLTDNDPDPDAGADTDPDAGADTEPRSGSGSGRSADPAASDSQNNSSSRDNSSNTSCTVVGSFGVRTRSTRSSDTVGAIRVYPPGSTMSVVGNDYEEHDRDGAPPQTHLQEQADTSAPSPPAPRPDEVLVSATLVDDVEQQQPPQAPQDQDVLVYDAEAVDETTLRMNKMVSQMKTRKFKLGCLVIFAIVVIVIGGTLIGTSVAKSRCQAPDQSKLGDGICDGSDYNTAQCDYDGGDCVQYNTLVEQGCLIPMEDAYRLGDGICDGGVFVSADACQLDDGDCEPITWNIVGSPMVGEAEGDESGAAIAFSDDGSIVAAAAAKNSGASGLENSGHVRVYAFQQDLNWTQLGSDIDGGEAVGDSFGTSIAMSSDGRRLIVGANRQVSNQTGYAVVYNYDASAKDWIQVGNKLVREEPGPDVFGSAVAMSGDGSIVAVGAPLANGEGLMRGACYTYQYNSVTDSWDKMGVIDGEVDRAFSAGSLSMSPDGTRLAIGAPFDNAGGTQRGTTRIYDYGKTNGWTKVGGNIAGEDGDGSGWSLSLSAHASRIAIGSPSQDKVRVYTYDGEEKVWKQIGSHISGDAIGGEFGGSVSLSSDGERLAVGAKSARMGRGRVQIFHYVGGTWLQNATNIDGTFLTDGYGWAVRLSADGQRVAFGAPNVGSAAGELSMSGSVWVFEEP